MEFKLERSLGAAVHPEEPEEVGAFFLNPFLSLDFKFSKSSASLGRTENS